MKNKYCIAHVTESPEKIGVDLKAFIQELTSDISRKFKTKDVHRFIEPHFTFKAPFWADDAQIKELSEKILPIITEFVHNQKMLPLKKIRSFDRNVIFWGSVNEREETEFKMFTQKLCTTLHDLPWMILSPFDPLSVPHLTLAKHFYAEQYDNIFSYAEEKTRMIKSMIDIDSLSLLQQSGDKIKKWEIIETWK